MRTTCYWLVMCLVACVAAGADLGTVKQQMQDRLAAVNRLKASGSLGENNRGYLEVIEQAAGAADLAAAENADRKVVYESIAAGAGTTAELVGRQRARDIAQRSRPGIKVQGEDGSWYVKKAASP